MRGKIRLIVLVSLLIVAGAPHINESAANGDISSGLISKQAAMRETVLTPNQRQEKPPALFAIKAQAKHNCTNTQLAAVMDEYCQRCSCTIAACKENCSKCRH
jgi:hypothetical protein